MSHLFFDKPNSRILLLDSSNAVVAGPYPAANNVDSSARGPWPPGTFRYLYYVPLHEAADPNSAYGEHGILIFDVPDRSGMGVHSGRRDKADGLGRKGPQHCTLGCIRTTDEAMAAFLRGVSTDPLQTIVVVVDNSDGPRSTTLAYGRALVTPQPAPTKMVPRRRNQL